jgi:hypothetical protein
MVRTAGRRTAAATVSLLAACASVPAAQADPGASGAATASARSSTLVPGAVLKRGEERRSPNRKYRLVMRRNGDLVLARSRGRVLWSSQTAGHPGAHAKLRRNGELVVFSRKRRVLYDTGTAGASGSRLVVRNRGEAVLVREGARVWSSRTDTYLLTAGQLLRPGQSRRSQNRRFLLQMQDNGDLAIIDRQLKQARWTSQTPGNSGAYAVMQRAGNLVVYSKSGAALYSSGTIGGAGTFLAMQDQGNAVIYEPAGTALWSSETDLYQLSHDQLLRAGQSRRSPNGRYVLGMQADGNLGLFDVQTHQALWTSGTGGNPGAFAAMGADGNFVVLSATSPPVGGWGQQILFQTATHGDPATHLVVQDDGSAVVYTGTGAALWSSKLGRL